MDNQSESNGRPLQRGISAKASLPSNGQNMSINEDQMQGIDEQGITIQ